MKYKKAMPDWLLATPKAEQRKTDTIEKKV